MLGDLLYRLRDVDLGGQYFETYVRESQQSLAQANILSEFLVPQDKVLILTSAGFTGSAGAGQLCTGLFLGIKNLNNSQVRYFVRDFEAARNLALRAWNWSGYVPILGGDSVVCFHRFDAGANANDTRLGLVGYLVPRGNIGAG